MLLGHHDFGLVVVFVLGHLLDLLDHLLFVRLRTLDLLLLVLAHVQLVTDLLHLNLLLIGPCRIWSCRSS